MFKRLVLGLAAVMTLGQGCVFTPATYTTSTVTPTGDPSPEGPVGFKEGFGKLPGAAPQASLAPGPRPSIVLGAELPKFPPDVTVLRQHRSTPDSILLENMAVALQIPAETLGRDPVGNALTLGWRDDLGFRWTYDASLNRMTFDRVAQPTAATVRTLRDDDSLIQTVKTFLDGRSILTRGWGKPELSFSWSKWWAASEEQNRCMDEKSLAAVRELGRKGDLDVANAPLLPFRDSGARCMDHEYPALQSVDYAATRDEQLVLNGKGASAFAARIVVDVATGAVANGWVGLPPELARANYPPLPADEVLERLRAGGLNPIEGSSPAVTITLDSFVIGLYRHTVRVDDQSRSYFLPALWARGKVRRADGSTTGYATVIPLVRDDQFSG